MNYNQGKKNYHLVIFSVILFFYMFRMQISYKLNSGQEMELDGSSPAFQRIVVTVLGCSCPVLVEYMFVQIVQLTPSLVLLTPFCCGLLYWCFVLEKIDGDMRSLIIKYNQVKKDFKDYFREDQLSF